MATPRSLTLLPSSQPRASEPRLERLGCTRLRRGQERQGTRRGHRCERDLHGFVAARSSPDRNVGCLTLLANREIETGAHDRSPCGPFQETDIDKRVNDMA